MRIFYKGKDGGLKSNVTGFWLIEIKFLFSIALLKFENGTREEFHNHAFNSISWLLTGKLDEEFLDKPTKTYHPSFKPIITTRDNMHRVRSEGDSYVLTFRGPWTQTWNEYLPHTDSFLKLGFGRKLINS